MSKIIYNNKIITLFFIFLPIVEMITSISKVLFGLNITLGMIYKTIFVIYGIIYLLFVNKENRKKGIIFIGVFLIYCIIHFLVTVPSFSTKAVFTNIVNISRYITFPFSLYFLYIFGKDYKLSISILNKTALVYGLIMFIAFVTKTAFPTYTSIGIEKGQSGYFISGNEISNMLSIFLPICLYYFIKNNKFFMPLLFVTIGLLIIGTKTSLIGLILGTISIFIFYYIKFKIEKKNSLKKELVCIGIYFLIIVLLIPITPAFKFMIERYNKSKETVCSSPDCEESVVESFIFNGRQYDLNVQRKIYLNADIKQKLFGIADSTKIFATDGQFDIIEQDFHDILFIYGFLGLIIYLIPALYIIIENVVNIIKGKHNISDEIILSMICTLLAFSISFIAGHVLLASTVSILLAYMICTSITSSYNNKEKKKIVIYMPKLSIGGMEKALINMLNMSNTLKEYDVRLVLGYVTDKKLLEALPKEIEVVLLCNTKWNFLGKIEAGINGIIEAIYILNTDFDYSICYSYHHKVLSILSRLASKQNILFIHTDLIASRSKEEIEKLNTKVKFEKFSKIVCVSKKSKEAFKKLYPNYKNDIFVIYNYIDYENILKLSKEKITDLKKENVITFINVSRHVEKSKKISRLILSAKKLKAEGYNFMVWLVGNGPDNKLYKDMIIENNLGSVVMLLGEKLNPYNYILNADYVIISSSFEGYGVVIDEARTLNKSIICTDIADASSIIKEDYGLVVENSENGIYLGMKNALDNKILKPKTFDATAFNYENDKLLKRLLQSF